MKTNLTKAEQTAISGSLCFDDEDVSRLRDTIERLDRELTAKIEHCKRLEDEVLVLTNQNEELQAKVDAMEDNQP